MYNICSICDCSQANMQVFDCFKKNPQILSDFINRPGLGQYKYKNNLSICNEL